DNLVGGSAANMVDVQGPLYDVRTYLNNDLEPKVQTALPRLVTSLPSPAVDGQEVYYVAEEPNGIVWHLRYRAASISSYKWECVGGPPLLAEHGADSVGFTAVSYANTTPVVVIMVPLAGVYDVEHSCVLYNNTPNGTTYQTFWLGGGGADADGFQGMTDTANGTIPGASGRVRRAI